MKNYMKDVAKLLGVEIGEEFTVKNYPIIARIGEGGLSVIYSNSRSINTGCHMDGCLILSNLLTGACTIEHKPWKPKYKDTYWSIGTGGVLEHGTWLNDFVDISLYRLGNCYRTAEEASANADKWIAFCNSDETIKC